MHLSRVIIVVIMLCHSLANGQTKWPVTPYMSIGHQGLPYLELGISNELLSGVSDFQSRTERFHAALLSAGVSIPLYTNYVIARVQTWSGPHSQRAFGFGMDLNTFIQGGRLSWRFCPLIGLSFPRIRKYDDGWHGWRFRLNYGFNLRLSGEAIGDTRHTVALMIHRSANRDNRRALH